MRSSVADHAHHSPNSGNGISKAWVGNFNMIIRLPKEGSFRPAQSLAYNAATRAFWRRPLATLARCSIRISRLCARTPAACGWRECRLFIISIVIAPARDESL
jgi:hypothetical protein